MKSDENLNKISMEEKIKILAKAISEASEKTILIDGFPESLEEALVFEEKILPINLIIKFECNEEICIKRLQEKAKINNTEFNEEEYKTKTVELLNNLKILTDFYSKYNIVKTIDCNNPIGAINDQIKAQIYPVIYSIIGKRYSGKTELSKILNQIEGISLINFDDFLNEPQIVKRKKENEFICQSFISKIRNLKSPRLLIENFPQNKEQYSYFVNNCKKFEKILYLNCDNSNCLERLNKININDPNYTSCSDLNLMLYEFEQNISFIDFLKEKTKLLEIDVNNHKIITINQMIKQIQPHCIIIRCKSDFNEAKNNLKDRLINNYHYNIIDINQVIEDGKKRNIPIAKKDELTIEDKMELIRPILFKESCDKFVLENFPNTSEELILFEKKLCKINKLIYISSDKVLNNIDNESSMEVIFKNQNKLNILLPDNISDYQIEECLDQTRDINVVYGLPLSGKSAIAKHLQQKCGFQLLDFKNLIEDVKKTKIDPENPDAEPEIAFPDLVNGLKNYLQKQPLNRRIVIDNFFIPVAPEPFLIDTFEKAMEIINTIGKFRNLYIANCDDEILTNRYKTKEGIGEELNEEQLATYKETLDKPIQLLEEIKKLSSNIININTNDTEEKSLFLFDLSFGRNFIIVKHDYNINIEKSLELFASRNQILYINVPKLIYNHFALNDEYSKKLESSYGKKTLVNPIIDKSNFDGYIYYKYNPIHFEPGLINEIILNYSNENYKQIENSGNYILISGYLNYDLLSKEDIPFNLPLLELKNIMDLGDLTAFIDITKKNIKQIETEPAIQLVIEKKKKEKVKDPLDVDGAAAEEGGENPEQPEEPPEEENPDGIPKFKPEEFKWTSYDGKPRNYVQILKRLKKYPVNETNVLSIEEIGKELDRILTTHIDNYTIHKKIKNDKIIADAEKKRADEKAAKEAKAAKEGEEGGEEGEEKPKAKPQPKVEEVPVVKSEEEIAQEEENKKYLNYNGIIEIIKVPKQDGDPEEDEEEEEEEEVQGKEEEQLQNEVEQKTDNLNN